MWRQLGGIRRDARCWPGRRRARRARGGGPHPRHRPGGAGDGGTRRDADRDDRARRAAGSLTSASAPVRLGLVGLGWFGGVADQSARATGVAEVVACFARSPRRAGHVRTRARLPRGGGAARRCSALPDVDAVMLATPHSTHADMIERAADAGKHVFVEKPPGADARRCRARGRRHCGGGRRARGTQSPAAAANRAIASMIERGELGTVLHLEGTYSVPGTTSPICRLWGAIRLNAPAKHDGQGSTPSTRSPHGSAGRRGSRPSRRGSPR